MEKIKYQDIPEQLLIPAVMVREIVKVRPLTIEEKRKTDNIGSDIIKFPYIGKPVITGKNEIVNNYTYLNGGKISIKGWKSSKLYVIMRQTNEPVWVMRIPKNNTVEKDGKEFGGSRQGDYLVYKTRADGTVDSTTASFIRADLFKKMCYIPPNEVITKHKNDKTELGKFTIKPSNKPRLNRDGHITNRPTNISGGTPTNGVQNVAKQNVTEAVVNTQKSTGKIMAVAQIVDDFGHRVGFVISDGTKEKSINLATASSLCKQRKISNLEIVITNGEPYFRGNGMSLDNLTKVYK